MPTILLVEDEVPIRMLAEDVLAEAGYAVFATGTAEAALTMIRGVKNLDLVIADIEIPDMSGPELVAQVRENYASFRVLYVSGHDPASLQISPEPGVEFLPKPFDMFTRLRRVSALLA